MIKNYIKKYYGFFVVLGFVLITSSVTWANSDNKRTVTSQEIRKSVSHRKDSTLTRRAVVFRPIL